MNRNVVGTITHNEYKDYCWIINVSDNHRIFNHSVFHGAKCPNTYKSKNIKTEENVLMPLFYILLWLLLLYGL